MHPTRFYYVSTFQSWITFFNQYCLEMKNTVMITAVKDWHQTGTAGTADIRVFCTLQDYKHLQLQLWHQDYYCEQIR